MSALKRKHKHGDVIRRWGVWERPGERTCEQRSEGRGRVQVKEWGRGGWFGQKSQKVAESHRGQCG